MKVFTMTIYLFKCFFHSVFVALENLEQRTEREEIRRIARGALWVLQGKVLTYRPPPTAGKICICLMYCHVPARWGLARTTLAPGTDKTWGQGSLSL